METNTTEELLEKLQALTSQRDELNQRKTRIQVQIEFAKAELSKITDEMKALGTSPETIQQDEALARQELHDLIIEYESKLAQLREQIHAAEKLLS